MTDKVKNILNQQIMEELHSAYLYLALAARLESLNFKGLANWMTVQAKEEEDHAMGFFRFLLERGEEPVLLPIATPDISSVKTIADIFASGLKHEQHVTALINNIHEVALAEKDYALESFNRWYIDEQVEEEASAMEILEKVKLIGDNGPALYALDKELAMRAYTPSGPYAKAD